MISASRLKFLGAIDANQDQNITALQKKSTITTGVFQTGLGHYVYSDSYVRIGYHRTVNNTHLIIDTLQAYTGGHMVLTYNTAGEHGSTNNEKRFIWSGINNLVANHVYFVAGTGNPPTASEVSNAPTPFDVTVDQDVNAFISLGKDGKNMYDVQIKVGAFDGSSSFIFIVKKYE